MTVRFRATCAIAVLCLLPSCSRAAAPSETPGEAESDESTGESVGPSGGPSIDLDALQAREAEGLAPVDVAGPEKKWTAKVDASGPPTVSMVEGVTVVEIPIGSQAAVRCQIFPDDIDAAGTIGELLGGVAQKVELKRVAPSAMFVARDAPVAFVEALYVMATPKGKAAGQLKAAVQPASQLPVLCLHDEVGYRKTFEKVAMQFCESLRAAGAPPAQPTYLEIQLVKLGDLPIGFEKRELVKEKGARSIVTVRASFVPRAEAELQLVDGYMVETLDADGLLKQGVWVEADGGKLHTKVKVDRKKGAAYAYEGEVGGKAVKGDLTVKDGKGLPTSVSTAQRLARDVKNPKGFELVESHYVPKANPTALTLVRYSRQAGAPERTVQLETGPMKLTGKVDEHGLMERVDMPAGKLTLRVERELIRGKP